MSLFRMDITIPRLASIRQKLENAEDEVLAEPWHKLMVATGIIGKQQAILDAPLGPTGRTISLMYSRVQQRPLPLWVRVGTKAKHGGYGYAKKVHWTATSADVREWLVRAVGKAVRMTAPLMDRAAREIEKRWEQIH